MLCSEAKEKERIRAKMANDEHITWKDIHLVTGAITKEVKEEISKVYDVMGRELSAVRGSIETLNRTQGESIGKVEMLSKQLDELSPTVKNHAFRIGTLTGKMVLIVAGLSTAVAAVTSFLARFVFSLWKSP